MITVKSYDEKMVTIPEEKQEEYEINDEDINETSNNTQKNEPVKSLVVKKNSIFERIMGWFRRIIKKEKVTANNEEVNIINKSQKDDFLKNIEVNQTDVISLKYKLKNGDISISDLSNSELDDMINYYEKSVEEKRKRLQRQSA